MENLTIRSTCLEQARGWSGNNSRITISCSIRNKTTKEEILYVDKIVFVVLDENGKPMEHGVVEETLD